MLLVRQTSFFCMRSAFHTTVRLAAGDVKSNLAALRKKTGYTFANCKKALEMHNNDLELAEKWLHEQAQAMGWSKATKLAERTTSQGLVGVLVNKNIGAMVEVNCETDFVARNDNFRNFVDHAAKVCAEYTKLTLFDGDLWKMGFEAEAIRELKAQDGKSLGDHLALLIGIVGENAAIKRAICFKASNDVQLAGYAHPAVLLEGGEANNKTQYGRYGAIIALRSNVAISEELKRNLCQHIVGMNPRKVGEYVKDEPQTDKDNETCLIHQEYLLDEDKTVGEVLQEHDTNVLDYQRFECGGAIQSNIDQLKSATALSN